MIMRKPKRLKKTKEFYYKTYIFVVGDNDVLGVGIEDQAVFRFSRDPVDSEQVVVSFHVYWLLASKLNW